MSMSVVLNKHKKKIRFLIIGGISTTIDFIIYMILSKYIDINISKVISMTCSCTFSFIFNKSWTFSYKENINKKILFFYILGQVLNIGINTLTNSIVYTLCGIKIVSFIIATGVALIFNYLFQNFVVFKKESSR